MVECLSIYFFWDEHLLASNYSLKDIHHNGFCFPRVTAQMISPRTTQPKMGIMFSSEDEYTLTILILLDQLGGAAHLQ